MRHYIDDEMKLFTGAARSGHVPVLSTLHPYGHPEKDLTETRHLLSKLGWVETGTGNQSRRRVDPGRNKKCNRFMGHDERASKRCRDWIQANQTVLHVPNYFLEQIIQVDESRAADRQKELLNEMHTIERESLQGISRSLLIEKSNNWTDSLLHQTNNAKVQNFWEKMCKVYRTDMSQGIASLKSKSGYLFENS